MENKGYSKVILLTSAIVIGLMALSPLNAFGQGSSQAQWVGTMGSAPYNYNYSPQTEISTSNVQNLQVSWIYPIASAPKVYAGDEGISFTPMVVNGIVYTLTNYHLLLALNAKDGSVIWQKTLPILKFTFACAACLFANSTGHYHAIWYTSHVRGLPLVWVAANNYTIFAYNALTGDLNLQFTPFNPHHGASIPGDPKNFGYFDNITPYIIVDENRGVLVTGGSVTEDTDAGRGFFIGYDISQTPPKYLWTTPVIPPQDGSDPNWAIKSVQNMSHAWIYNGVSNTAVDLKNLPASQLNSMLYADWGTFGFNGTHSFAGAGIAWAGSWALDPSTGIAYVATAQQSPDINATFRPGPGLWANSVLALDSKTGKIIWAYKTTPHDLWDWDCSWGVILANTTINGQPHKAVFKGCKNGVVYGLDAATGAQIWAFNAPSIKRGAWNNLLDPTSASDMKKPWANYPSTKPFVGLAGLTGATESSPAYDPVSNTVIHATYNSPQLWTVQNVAPTKGAAYGTPGINFSKIAPAGPTNTTIWALDASTGQPKWSYFIDKLGFRGGTTVSNGVVYIARSDGFIDMVNVNTGKLIASKFIGSEMITNVAIAADANGDVKVVEVASGATSTGSYPGTSAPGFVFALGLAAPSVTTSVSTTAQTVVQTIVQTSVSTTTVSTGVDPSTLYAVAALAAVFIIATGVLAVRRRKPAA